MSLVYSRLVVKSHLAFLLSAMLFVAALHAMAVNLVATFDAGPIIAELLEQLPDVFAQFVNQQMLAGMTVKGAAAFAFNHPLVLIIMGVMAIGLANRHISGEIEAGTLELILAQPIKRSRWLLSLWISGVLMLALIVLAAFATSIVSLMLAEELNPDLSWSLLQIAVNAWTLFVLVMTYTILFAVYGRQGTRVALWSAGLTLLFWLLDIITMLSDAVDFIRPLNIFTYFQPQKLILGQRSFELNMAVLCALIVMTLGWSLVQFHRRDIPG